MRLRLVRTITGRDPQRAATQLPALQEAAAAASTTLDELSRGLYPRALSGAGVATALRETSATSPVPVEVLDATTRGYPSAVYFTCLEAVQNAVKHAAARRITVRLSDDGDALVFAVHDDGRGLPLCSRTAPD